MSTKLYTRWQDVPESAWTWPNFTPEEMACKGTGSLLIDKPFMDWLQRVRRDYNRPMAISSGYRSPTYNDQVSDTGLTGPHTTGRAVDVRVSGAAALALMQVACAYGVKGLGVSQKGAHASRFLHLDLLPKGDHPPRPWVWSY